MFNFHNGLIMMIIIIIFKVANMRERLIPIVIGALGTVFKSLEEERKEFENGQ